MQIAARMDFSRSQSIAIDARALALALASGIAGLSIAYPTVTVGHGTLDAWARKLEAKSPFLTLPAASRDMAITTTFLDTAQAAVNVMMAGGAWTKLSAAEPENTPRAVARNFTGKRQFVALNPPFGRPRGRVPEAALPQAVEHTPLSQIQPLDAVRIVLPPATIERGLPGAMPPEATLRRIAESDSRPATPTSQPAGEALAANVATQALAAPPRGSLSQSEPFSLSAAPQEVREFDLARLGSGNPEAKRLARASAGALAAAGRLTPRTPNLQGVTKAPDRVVGDHVIHVAALSLEGVPSGNLSVRVGMGGDLSVRLDDLLAPVRAGMAPDAFERLAGSTAASEYVSFADLRAAGFDIRYEAGDDRLMVSARP